MTTELKEWDGSRYLKSPEAIAIYLNDMLNDPEASKDPSMLIQALAVVARAKGMTEREVVRTHALRNALLPVVTVIGLSLGGLLSGAVLTETIFNFSGVGRTISEAITARDYVVVQGFTVIVSIGYVLVNLLTDISYAYLDPRVRMDS